MFIEKLLSDKFYEILEKHSNGRWATNELEWLVYEVHKWKYDKLTLEYRRDIDRFFKSLRRVYGNKLQEDI